MAEATWTAGREVALGTGLLRNIQILRFYENAARIHEIAMLDEQGLTINQAIASIVADYLVRLLLTQTLDKFQTYIDLNSGSMKSTYITPANVRKWKR